MDNNQRHTRITQPELSVALASVYEEHLKMRGFSLDAIDPLTAEMLATAEAQLAHVLNHLMALNAG